VSDTDDCRECERLQGLVQRLCADPSARESEAVRAKDEQIARMQAEHDRIIEGHRVVHAMNEDRLKQEVYAANREIDGLRREVHALRLDLARAAPLAVAAYIEKPHKRRIRIKPERAD
jgi:hypothetical protein